MDILTLRFPDEDVTTTGPSSVNETEHASQKALGVWMVSDIFALVSNSKLNFLTSGSLYDQGLSSSVRGPSESDTNFKMSGDAGLKGEAPLYPEPFAVDDFFSK